jgi:heme/copper-type cytochrome/quinol oxidase subunit 2
MAETMTAPSLPFRAVTLALAGAALCVAAPHSAVQEPPAHQRHLTVVARKYAFEPTRLEVNLNDLVKVTLSSPDIAHSFTVDAYRIAKRVGGGHTVTFEFRADQAGTFPVYCNLRQDERCRQMHGELVVHAK